MTIFDSPVFWLCPYTAHEERGSWLICLHNPCLPVEHPTSLQGKTSTSLDGCELLTALHLTVEHGENLFECLCLIARMAVNLLGGRNGPEGGTLPGRRFLLVISVGGGSGRLGGVWR